MITDFNLHAATTRTNVNILKISCTRYCVTKNSAFATGYL